MKKILIIGFIALFGMVSCDNNELDKELEDMSMEELFEEIQFMANSVPCQEASEWKVVAYGNKACGGPAGFIAYSSAIDTVRFLKLIELHTQAEKEYNEENDVYSDCSIAPRPIGVVCEGDQPVLVYEN